MILRIVFGFLFIFFAFLSHFHRGYFVYCLFLLDLSILYQKQG